MIPVFRVRNRSNGKRHERNLNVVQEGTLLNQSIVLFRQMSDKLADGDVIPN